MARDLSVNFGYWEEESIPAPETYWYSEDQCVWKTTSTSDTTWVIYKRECRPSIFIEERWKLVAEEMYEY